MKFGEGGCPVIVSYNENRRCESRGLLYLGVCGFGGLEVACWPLVPKFAGSNPTEAVGFFRIFPSEGK